MKSAAIAAAVGGVGYLIYVKITDKGGENSVNKVLGDVADQDVSGIGAAGKAVSQFRSGDVRGGVGSTVTTILKGPPVGHALEALNPKNSDGDRTISAGLAAGGVVYPPLNIASWLLPSGDKSTGEYWENAGEKAWKDIKDVFDRKTNRHEEFHWNPPNPREGLYRELWYQMQKWLDDYKWEIHPENRYSDFWADGYTRAVVDKFSKMGHALNDQDISFMNKWFDYFLYYNYEKRGRTSDYFSLTSSGKINDPMANVYRQVSDKYYEWIKERKNPDAEHGYKKFWESEDVKGIIEGPAKANAFMRAAGWLGQNQPGTAWSDADRNFMNTAFGIENAEIYWQEKSHGRID